MALIVEDGTGLATAESFCSVAFADSYLDLRGFALWAPLATLVKESALRKAADYMEQAYRERWAGYRSTSTQLLSWPRTLVPQKDSPGGYRDRPFYYGINIVPVLVQNACAALAYRASTTTLAPDLGRQTVREKVDVIEVDYLAGGRQTTRFVEIENMLATFFDPQNSAMNVRIRRA